MGDVATLRVRLQADLAEIDKMREKVTHSMRQINVVTRTQMREASGSVELLGEQFGVVMPRHLREFVAKLPGVSTAMSAAFNAVAVIALIGVVVEAGKKIEEFVKKNSEAAAKLKEAQESFGLTVQKTYNSYKQRLLEAGIKTDELRKDHLAALHKQLELIDMQGFNQLEGAFDKLDQAALKTFQNIQTNWLSTVANMSLQQSAGYQGSLQRFGSEYSSLLAQGKGSEAARLLNETQEREEANRAAMIAVRNAGLRSWKDAAPINTGNGYAMPDYGAKVNSALNLLRSRGITDYSDQSYNALSNLTQTLEAQQNVAASQRIVTASDKHNATLESSKASAADLLQALETQLSQRESSYEHITGDKLPMGQVTAFWAEHVHDFGKSTKEYQQVIDKLNAAAEGVHQQFKSITDAMKKTRQDDARFQLSDHFGEVGGHSVLSTSDAVDDAHRTLVRELAISQAKLNEEMTASRTRYAEATGAISQHDAAVAMAAAHQEAFNAELTALNAQLQKLAAATSLSADDAQKNADAQSKLRMQIAQLNGQAQAQSMEDAQATESAMDRVYDHIRQGAQNLDQKIAAIMARTIDGVNDQIVGAMFGDRTNFAKVFEGSSRSMAKAFLEWGEGSLMGKKHQTPQDKFSGAVDRFSGAVDKITSGGSASMPSDVGSLPSSGGMLSSIPGVSGFADSLKNSSIGQWMHANAGKYMPGAMTAMGGLMSMLQGPPHAKGEGSGVANALASAGYKQNTLSRWLSGMGQMAQGAGSMMFAGAGGMQGLDAAMMDSNMSSGMAGFVSNCVGGLPGFASGGSVYGGIPIMVGENGPEVWTPPGHGHITASRDVPSGNGGIHIGNIYGADPAITRQSVAQAIAASQSHAVVQAQRKIMDRQRRTPR